ncbi:MAG: MBL fold metallo-hydrolase [Clostridia bacterium]|nr:MBL fold metallo-hydrolase [Clostridia bacterium]
MVRFMSLMSGSGGNSTLISDGETSLLIDCGMSGSALSKKLDSINMRPEELSGVLITHEHSDHTGGVGVIARRYGIPVYATEKTFAAMNAGKIDPGQLHTVRPGVMFSAGSIDVQPFSIPHDAADPVGYSFFADGCKYTLATDIGFMPDSLFENLRGSKSIILESNHDIEMLRYGAYPYYLKQRILSQKGHLSNDITAETAVRLADTGTDKIMLAHLSHENNTPEIAQITTKNALDRSGYGNVRLSVAARYEITSFAV